MSLQTVARIYRFLEAYRQLVQEFRQDDLTAATHCRDPGPRRFIRRVIGTSVEGMKSVRMDSAMPRDEPPRTDARPPEGRADDRGS